MPYQKATPEQLEQIILAATIASSGVAKDYLNLPQSLIDQRYSVAPLYAEWLHARSQEPVVHDVAPFVMGSSTMGLCFGDGRTIWMSTDERFRPSYGNTLLHERYHALIPERHPDHAQNELLNRLATYASTSDATQLAGFYHP